MSIYRTLRTKTAYAAPFLISIIMVLGANSSVATSESRLQVALPSSIGDREVYKLKEFTGGEVKIVGKAAVGKTLTAEVSGFTPSDGVLYAYQWLRDGKAIKGATGKTYQVQGQRYREGLNQDEGKTLRVRVTAFKPGYAEKQ